MWVFKNNLLLNVSIIRYIPTTYTYIFENDLSLRYRILVNYKFVTKYVQSCKFGIIFQIILHRYSDYMHTHSNSIQNTHSNSFS